MIPVFFWCISEWIRNVSSMNFMRKGSNRSLGNKWLQLLLSNAALTDLKHGRAVEINGAKYST